MVKAFKQNLLLKIIISLTIPMLIVIIKPIGMTLNQSIILGSLFLTIAWWASGIVHKNVASIFLLLVFVIFGNTPIKNVFIFPLSENFILVLSSYMISQGIVNSKVADKISDFLLKKYCVNSVRLVIMSFILGIVLMFMIPQPFPRVILLSSIYINFLNDIDICKEERSILLFSIFVASTVTSLMFLNGDVIINYSALKFGSITMSYVEWAKNMAVPTLFVTAIIAIIFIIIFKKNLKTTYRFKDNVRKVSFDKKSKKAIVITTFIIILWLTESMHGIGSAYVALTGVGLMFLTGIISLKDIKAINLSLLIFLTAEFSIGKVLVGSRVATNLSDYLFQFFPDTSNGSYVLYIVCFIMVLHMFMGSLVTAISVLIPTLITMTAGYLSPELIVMLTIVTVGFHYVLPFHHVSIMIGYGNGYYENKHTIKIGIALTFITFLAVFLIYMPWWRFVGLL